jgi:hypothetical protein
VDACLTLNCFFLIFISRLQSYNPLAAYQKYFEPFVPLQLRRERIAERMRALQELVPNTNKVIMLL